MLSTRSLGAAAVRRLGVWAVLASCAGAAGFCQAADAAFDIELRAGDQLRRFSPVRVAIELPAALSDAKNLSLTLVDSGGKPHSAQLAGPALLAAPGESAGGKPTRELNFIVDRLPAGTSEHWLLTLSTGEPTAVADSSSGSDSPQYRWKDTPGDHADLVYGGAESNRPVLRYMYQPLDESSKDTRTETFKVYHHAFDPTGVTLLTKGPGGQFTHHRGLFFGFNKVTYDAGAKKADVWHCTGDAYQSHDDFLASEAGPVLGRHRVSIGWHGPEKEIFATEHRELTAYAPPAPGSDRPQGTLVEFASRVRPSRGEVKLDGDPQHAGFHFRAAQEVSDRAEQIKKDLKDKKAPPDDDDQTYYVRPDGVGKLGETRNWDVKNQASKDQVNFPWKGMSFVVAGKRYTVAYLDKPTNPKESRFSERDYGRFGSYFEYTMTPERPLEVSYRVWIQAGEMTPDDIASFDADFVRPIEAIVSGKQPAAYKIPGR